MLCLNTDTRTNFGRCFVSDKLVSAFKDVTSIESNLIYRLFESLLGQDMLSNQRD